MGGCGLKRGRWQGGCVVWGCRVLVVHWPDADSRLAGPGWVCRLASPPRAQLAMLCHNLLCHLLPPACRHLLWAGLQCAPHCAGRPAPPRVSFLSSFLSFAEPCLPALLCACVLACLLAGLPPGGAVHAAVCICWLLLEHKPASATLPSHNHRCVFLRTTHCPATACLLQV